MNKNVIILVAIAIIVAVFGVAKIFFPRPLDPRKEYGMMSMNMGQKAATKGPADRTPLPFTEKGGVKEFKLNAQAVNWEYAQGKTVVAWGYNGQVPGPEIRVTEGDTVRIAFTNELPVATTIHWHGIDVPNAQDGIPGVTQKAIEPGSTYIYEFVATPAGTHMYHTHGSSAMMDEAEQLDMGLAGSFIVEPKSYTSKPDKEYTIVLDEWNTSGMGMGGSAGAMKMEYDTYTINGRAFPNTEPLNVKKGDRVRLRLINAGTSTIHPMHLHGYQFKVVATDGNPVPEAAQLTRNTLPIHPGETYDIEFIANNPGTWLFHCHELHHADGGMIMPIVVE
ncbi:MAG: copper oxidase [Candidatus Yonathbacteria bacterium]|nr:copper oxidase [Candidatus Yonathbacteria bacterium]